MTYCKKMFCKNCGRFKISYRDGVCADCDYTLEANRESDCVGFGLDIITEREADHIRTRWTADEESNRIHRVPRNGWDEIFDAPSVIPVISCDLDLIDEATRPNRHSFRHDIRTLKMIRNNYGSTSFMVPESDEERDGSWENAIREMEDCSV